MKILFLDVDGVLNSQEYIYTHQRGDAISPEMVERVNQIIDATGAQVVISSTWRLLHKMSILKQILESKGFKGNIIDYTPHLNYKDFNRGDEIAAWLKDKNIDKFVILDDESDMNNLITNLVQTAFKTGIQDIHIQKAIDMLNGN